MGRGQEEAREDPETTEREDGHGPRLATPQEVVTTDCLLGGTARKRCAPEKQLSSAVGNPAKASRCPHRGTPGTHPETARLVTDTGPCLSPAPRATLEPPYVFGDSSADSGSPYSSTPIRSLGLKAGWKLPEADAPRSHPQPVRDGSW